MNGESKKEQLRLRRLIYGTFSASTKLPSYPDGGNKIIDIEIVYRPGVCFGNSLGIKQLREFGYITSEALRGCLKSRW